MDTDFSLEDKDDNLFSSEIKVTHDESIKERKPHSRRNTKVTDCIYTMQNAIFEKILLKDYTKQDLFSFLVYDLMLNHDKSFTKLKSKLKEETHIDTLLQPKLEISFLKEMIEQFREKECELFNQLKECLTKDESYLNDSLVYSSELCVLISDFTDVASQTKCFKVEVEEKKKYNFTNNRKSIFNEIYSLVRPNTVNVKLMGGAVYRECKKLKIGKSNGFTNKYLSIEKESSASECTPKKRRHTDKSQRNQKSLTQPFEKIKIVQMPVTFYEDTNSRNDQNNFDLNFKKIKILDETEKTINESKKLLMKNLCKSVFDDNEEREGLCNEDFLHAMLQFDDGEDDPDLRYKIIFRDDFDDQHGYISKMESKEKEGSQEFSENLSL